MVSCLSINGDKDVRRLAEIEANLLNSPLTAAERLEHLAERLLLQKQMRLKPGHGGDRRSKDFQVGKNFQLENPILSEAEKIGMSDRTIRNATCFCKRLSVEERNRLKGTAVENRYKDLFAIAGISDIQQRTAARSWMPRSPCLPCMRRSIARDLCSLRNAISRRRPIRRSIRRQTSCSGPFSMPGTLRWSGFFVKSQIESPTSSKFCPRW